jgi:hypothetical protein
MVAIGPLKIEVGQQDAPTMHETAWEVFFHAISRTERPRVQPGKLL